MRHVADIPHPAVKITLLAWNGKFLLKLEQGNLEQTYKVAELDLLTGTDAEVRELLDDDFWPPPLPASRPCAPICRPPSTATSCANAGSIPLRILMLKIYFFLLLVLTGLLAATPAAAQLYDVRPGDGELQQAAPRRPQSAGRWQCHRRAPVFSGLDEEQLQRPV